MAFSASRRENTVPVAALLVLQQIICVASSMPFSSRGMVSNLPPVASVASSAYAPAARPPIPSTFTGRCRSATLGRSRRVLLGEGKEHEIASSSIFDLRGGASVISEDDDNEYDLDDSSSEESDIDLDDESSEVEEEGDEEEEEETEDEDEEDSKVSSSSPVKLVISTGLGCPLIDQTLETNASRSRTIATIRQTVSRQMKGRPPIESVRLLLGNRVLRDDEIIDDLAPDEDDEDDELDEDDEEDDEDDGMVKLRLTLDAVPPVDPKFGVELQEQLQKMSTAELLEAYAANAAAAHEGVARMFACASAADDHLSEDNDDDEEEDDEEDNIGGRAAAPVITTMRQHAALIKESIVETMPQNAIEILNQSADESEGAALASVVASAHRHRRGGAMKGGASTQVKRALQRNLNINWADTIRNFVLFLFFGYFGGRDPLSRSIMYLGAPLCFVLQARPVKIAMKQLFYTVGNPPAILLSLLPAPQQAIMSLNYDAAMTDLYGKEGVSLGGGAAAAASGQRSFEEDEIDEEEEEDGGAYMYDAEESDPYDDYDAYY